MSNKELVKKLIIVTEHLAMAQNWHEPNKEKRYVKEMIKLEMELLKRMEK